MSAMYLLWQRVITGTVGLALLGWGIATLDNGTAGIEEPEIRLMLGGVFAAATFVPFRTLRRLLVGLGTGGSAMVTAFVAVIVSAAPSDIEVGDHELFWYSLVFVPLVSLCLGAFVGYRLAR